jgi:peptidoglycan hydrolase-like amidase
LALPRAARARLSTVKVGWREPGNRVSLRTIEMEDYTSATLNGETGVFTIPTTLEALARTIRTFARTNPRRNRAKGFEFCDTTHCRRALRGAPTERRAKISRALAPAAE